MSVNPVGRRVTRRGRRGRGRRSNFMRTLEQSPEQVDGSSIIGREVLDTLKASRYHSELAAHMNTVNLQITVPAKQGGDPDVANPTFKAVITAGRHADKYTGRVLTDGVNGLYNYPNGGNEVKNVVVTTDFGISDVSSVKGLHDMITDKGLSIVGTTYRFSKEGDPTNTAQLINKLKFTHWDEFGDHEYYQINPEWHLDPKNYLPNYYQLDSQYILNRDTILELDIMPGYTVTFTFFVSNVLNTDKLLLEALKQQGLGKVLAK